MLDESMIHQLFETKKQGLITEIFASPTGVVILKFAGAVQKDNIQKLEAYIADWYPEASVMFDGETIIRIDVRSPVGYIVPDPNEALQSFRSAKDLISYLKRVVPDSIISLLRHAVPQMIAFDVIGVQPMIDPVEPRKFKMQSKYTNAKGEVIESDNENGE